MAKMHCMTNSEVRLSHAARVTTSTQPLESVGARLRIERTSQASRSAMSLVTAATWLAGSRLIGSSHTRRRRSRTAGSRRSSMEMRQRARSGNGT